MAEKGKLDTAEKTIRTAYSKFGVFSLIVGLFALLATVASVVIVLRSEKTEVTAQVLACDELTEYSTVAELKGSFTYLGEEVAHLWKLKVKFVNSGDKTIVGTGSQKNILGEGLNFVFPDDARILNIEDEADTFDSSITQPKPNQIQISFKQWRSGEYNIISFYIASDKSLEVDPCPSVPTRDIIDGDVFIQDLTERRPLERISLIDRLNRPVSVAGKIMGGVVAGLLAIVLVIVVPWGWKDSVPFIMWKRRYLSSFCDYLEHVEPKLSAYRKWRYIDSPNSLSKKLWANFDGPQAPSRSPMFGSIKVGVIITVVLLAMAFGLVSLVLMLFPV